MSPRLHNGPPSASIETPIGEAWVESGVLWHRIRPGTVITKTDAVQTVAALEAVAGSKRYPAVVDIREAVFADRTARSVFAESADFEVATALIVDSKLSRALGNSYLNVTRPSRPTRIFDSVEAARRWALGFITAD